MASLAANDVADDSNNILNIFVHENKYGSDYKKLGVSAMNRLIPGIKNSPTNLLLDIYILILDVLMSEKNKIMRTTMLFLAVTLFIRCNNMKKERAHKEESFFYSFQYERVKKECVPKRFFSHLPVSVNTPFFFQAITDDMAKSYSYLLTLYDCNIDSLKFLELNLKESSLKSFSSTDSTMLILKEDYSYRKIKEHIMEGGILVPFFNNEIVSSEETDLPDFFSSKTPVGLSSNFEIFIVETKSVYNSTESEKMNVFKELPIGHNEVYVQGVCINLKSEYVIYWTIFF